MTEQFIPDELTHNGEQYFYRDGSWTNKVGMCVPVTRSQGMTMEFFKAHGRLPVEEPKPKARRNTKATRAKAEAVRDAIVKARAAQTKK